MSARLAKTFSALVMLIGGASIAIASPANAAQPQGCTLNVPSLNQNSAGQLVANGNGHCDARTTRTFGVLIYWDKNFAPDPLVAKGDQRGSLNVYSKTIYSCDGGNTRGYYSQASWTGFDYYESGRKNFNTCA